MAQVAVVLEMKVQRFAAAPVEKCQVRHVERIHQATAVDVEVNATFNGHRLRRIVVHYDGGWDV